MYEDSLGSLTIDATPARQSVSALGRDFDEMGNSFERANDKMVKEVQETVRETRRLSEASREWKRMEESIGGSTAAMEKYNRLSGEADRALASGRINAEQHGIALQRLGARYKYLGEQAAHSTKLAAHELNNLSFQAQDFLVQVGSGQGIFRPLLQQAPQAVGAVGGVGRAVSLLATPTMGAVAGFAAMAAGAAVVASRVSDISEQTRHLDATLRTLNPGLGASGDSLRKMSFDIASDTGATRRDAAAIVAQVVRNRQIVSGEMVKQISGLAADMAPALGGDAAKIGGDLAGAFSKGAAGIRELDRELGFLTPELSRTIRELDEGGHRAEATGLAMDALKGRFGGAARDMESEWTKSTKLMGEAWDGFMERVANSKPVSGAARVGADVLKGWTAWLTPSDPQEEALKRELKDYLEAEEAVRLKSEQFRDAMQNGQTGPGVDLLHRQLDESQRQFYELAKAIEEAKRAKDGFNGLSGATPSAGMLVPIPGRKPTPDGIAPDEQKRLDDLAHGYEREQAAMRGNSVERGIRLSGLAAENSALEAGRTAQAAKAEGLIAERRSLSQLVTGHADNIDSMRLEVEQQERVASASRGGIAARQEAERAAQVALQTSGMLRAAHAAEARGEEDLAGQLRNLAGVYDDLSRKGADAAKLGGINTMIADNEASSRMARAEAGTIGMNDGDRRRVLGQIQAQNELLRQGVDLQGDLTPEVRSAAEEYMRIL